MQVQELLTYPQAIARQLLIAEGCATIRIPLDAEFTSLETRGEGRIHYLRFRQGIRSGHVPCYLHPDDAAYRGEEITAQFRLYRRVHVDDTEHIHIDYMPAETQATHRLFFLTEEELGYCDEEWSRFLCPQISNGYVVVAPVHAKLNVPKKEVPPPVADPQLDRLLKAGWSIKEDRGDVVTLTRSTPKGEKEMTHKRPKKK